MFIDSGHTKPILLSTTHFRGLGGRVYDSTERESPACGANDNFCFTAKSSESFDECGTFAIL